jgi:hypothetical protein
VRAGGALRAWWPTEAPAVGGGVIIGGDGGRCREWSGRIGSRRGGLRSMHRGRQRKERARHYRIRACKPIPSQLED